MTADPDTIELWLWLITGTVDAVVVVPEGLGVSPLPLPRSEISLPDGAEFGRKVPVRVPRWLALDRGLISPADPNQGELL